MENTKESILYLDDNLTNLTLFYEVFKEQYEAETVSSPSEAMEHIARKAYKVILVDYVMPEMTGLEFIERASEILPNCIFIIITAYPDLDVIISAINQGDVFRFLFKPWKSAELSQTLELAFNTYNTRLTYRTQLEDLQRKNELLEKEISALRKGQVQP